MSDEFLCRVTLQSTNWLKMKPMTNEEEYGGRELEADASC